MYEYEMVTYSGQVVNPLLLGRNRGKFTIRDIAHHLTLTNRYSGATYVPYSVAEHSVRMSEAGFPGSPLAMLMHDAAEAYVGDIVRFQKKALYWEIFGVPKRFKAHEDYLLSAIVTDLGLGDWVYKNELGIIAAIKSPEVKKADEIMAATEIRDLMPRIEDESVWGVDLSLAMGKVIEPWGDWQYTEERFIQRFRELTNGKSKIGPN